MSAGPTYRIAKLGQRKRLTIQLRAVELVEGKVRTGGAVQAAALRAFRCRMLVRCGSEPLAPGSVLLLTDAAAGYLLASGAVEEITLENLPAKRPATPEARKARGVAATLGGS